MKKHTSVVKALLVFGVSMIVVLLVTILVVVSSLFNRGVSRTTQPLFQMVTTTTDHAGTPGVPLQINDEIAAALRPFTDTPLFTSIRVKNGGGSVLFTYRRPCEASIA